MEVPPPTNLKRRLVVPEKLLMGPGPSNCPPRVLHAMSLPTLGHLHVETTQLMDQVKEGIQYVFQTRNPLTLAISASGHAGMEAIMCNILEVGDKILIAVNGLWGQRAAEIAKRYGATVFTIEAPLGENFDDYQFEEAIKKYRPQLVFATEGESSTGVYQPVRSIGDICQKYNCLLAVDVVASLGGVPFYMDKWNVDIVYTGSQKVLGAPAGITPISFSSKAEQKIRNRKTAIKNYYLDMTLLGQYWNCFQQNQPRLYHHTISTPLLFALREALALVAEEGLENVVLRHRKCARLLYSGLKNLGLECFVEDETKRIPTVTAIRVPEGLFWKDVSDYAMKRHNAEISGGLGPTAGKIFRIGLMGYNANEENVKRVLEVFEDSLITVGKMKHSKL